MVDKELLEDKLLLQANGIKIEAERLLEVEDKTIFNKEDLHLFIEGVDSSTGMTSHSDPFKLIQEVVVKYNYTEVLNGETWNEQLKDVVEALVGKIQVFYVLSNEKNTKKGAEFVFATYENPIDERLREYIEARIVGFIVFEIEQGDFDKEQQTYLIEDYVYSNLSNRNALYNDDLWSVVIDGKKYDTPTTTIRLIETITELLLGKR